MRSPRFSRQNYACQKSKRNLIFPLKFLGYNTLFFFFFQHFEDKQKHKRQEIKNRPLFESPKPSSTITKEPSVTLSTSKDGSKKNLRDIQKRLGLNKVKGHSGFGEDFDSPMNKRTSKSTTNLGLVVVKKKRKIIQNDANSEASDQIRLLKHKINDGIEDLTTTESNSRLSYPSHDSSLESKGPDSITSDRTRTPAGVDNVKELQASKIVTSVGTVDASRADNGGESLRSKISSETSSDHVTSTGLSISLCDYTSSSDSD